MTEILNKLVVDCTTGISTEVPLTEEELKQHESDRLAFEEAETKRLEDEAKKQTLKDSANNKLKALGLTDEEIIAITK
jgi:hypothetical protein